MVGTPDDGAEERNCPAVMEFSREVEEIHFLIWDRVGLVEGANRGARILNTTPPLVVEPASPALED